MYPTHIFAFAKRLVILIVLFCLPSTKKTETTCRLKHERGKFPLRSDFIVIPGIFNETSW